MENTTIEIKKKKKKVKRMGTNAFFLPPFFPLEILLFFPTAIALQGRSALNQGAAVTRNPTCLSTPPL